MLTIDVIYGRDLIRFEWMSDANDRAFISQLILNNDRRSFKKCELYKFSIRSIFSFT
jgi:hypothetical protein